MNGTESRLSPPHPLASVWRTLDRLYLISGYAAAACLALIFLTTVLQVLSRLSGINISGLTDYAGYFMAASAFLAFAHTFNHGSHIRIELFLSMMGRFRAVAEWFSFFVAVVVTGWLCWFAWAMVYWSYKLNDMSQGLDATPIWIPQLSMAIGLSIFAVSVVDHTLRLIITGQHQLPASPDAL